MEKGFKLNGHDHVNQYDREYQCDRHIAETRLHVLRIACRRHAVRSVLRGVFAENFLHNTNPLPRGNPLHIGPYLKRALPIVAFDHIRCHSDGAVHQPGGADNAPALRFHKRVGDLIRVVPSALLRSYPDIIPIAALVERAALCPTEPGHQLIRKLSDIDVEIIGKGTVQRKVDPRFVHLEIGRYIDKPARIFRQILLDHLSYIGERFRCGPLNHQRDIRAAPGSHLDIHITKGGEFFAKLSHNHIRSFSLAPVDQLNVDGPLVHFFSKTTADNPVGISDARILLNFIDHLLDDIFRHFERGLCGKLNLHAKPPLIFIREKLRPQRFRNPQPADKDQKRRNDHRLTMEDGVFQRSFIF